MELWPWLANIDLLTSATTLIVVTLLLPVYSVYSCLCC